MVKPFSKVLGAFSGAALLLFSFLGSAVSILALIDPVGAKAADDSDPLGIPPSVASSLGILGFYLAIGAVGLYLLWLCYRRSTPNI